MIKYFYICVFFIFSSIPVLGQQIDSLETTLLDTTFYQIPIDSNMFDSSESKEQPRPKPFVLKPLWYDADGMVIYSSDSLRFSIFNFKDILHKNYNGAADIFRSHPAVQVYDLLEMGMPRYIGGYNLLPHQTGIVFDDRIVNDPINGMYNMRMIPLDILESIETKNDVTVAVSPSNHGSIPVSFSTRNLDSEQPYTRIMFRQGDFGYTDLDITFAHRISKKIAFQLGGINKYYDPNGYRGINYRGALSLQLSPDIYWRTRMHLGDEQARVLNLSEYNNYQFDERRNDFQTDLHIWTDDQHKEFWRIQAALSTTRRTTSSTQDSFKLDNKYDRFQLGISRLWKLNSISANTGVSAFQQKIWGSLYQREYFESAIQAYFDLLFQLNKNIYLKASGRGSYYTGDDILFNPGIEATWKSESIAMRLAFQKTNRAPFRNERSIYFRGIQGNQGLDIEQHNTVNANLKYRITPVVNLGLEAGYRSIKDEIKFDGLNFNNGPERQFTYLTGSLDFSFYNFRLAGGGLISDAKVSLSPAKSGWAEIRFHDVWLDGAIIFDAIGSVYAYEKHQTLHYNPIAERIYWTDGNLPSYYYFTYKLVATVKDAQLYLAMDNPQPNQYQYISGYYEFYRRIQFGINWILWD